ncbi:MAG: hypothetical protein AB8G86_01475 [Saprospiraceae bacterium]
MKSSFLKFLVFTLFISFFACGDSPLDAVDDLFEEYKVAIEQKQYGKAAGLIDQKSVEYYNQVIKLALEKERKDLGAVNFNSKLMALALRQFYSKKELKDLTGEQVFAFAAENHLNPMDSIGQYTIAKTVMESGLSKAVSRMYRKGELTETYLKFIKVDGVWKMNFASVMNDDNDLNTSIVLSGIKDENKRAIKIVESISGKRVKRNIWVPAKRW